MYLKYSTFKLTQWILGINIFQKVKGIYLKAFCIIQAVRYFTDIVVFTSLVVQYSKSYRIRPLSWVVRNGLSLEVFGYKKYWTDLLNGKKIMNTFRLSPDINDNKCWFFYNSFDFYSTMGEQILYSDIIYVFFFVFNSEYLIITVFFTVVILSCLNCMPCTLWQHLVSWYMYEVQNKYIFTYAKISILFLYLKSLTLLA